VSHSLDWWRVPEDSCLHGDHMVTRVTWPLTLDQLSEEMGWTFGAERRVSIASLTRSNCKSCVVNINRISLTFSIVCFECVLDRYSAHGPTQKPLPPLLGWIIRVHPCFLFLFQSFELYSSSSHHHSPSCLKWGPKKCKREGAIIVIISRLRLLVVLVVRCYSLVQSRHRKHIFHGAKQKSESRKFCFNVQLLCYVTD